MKKEFLCLIGGGWLGKPLAKKLTDEQFQLVITTLHDKRDQLNLNGVSYIQYDIINDPFPQKTITQADVLIYTIPPLNFNDLKNFFDQVPIDKKIIFTSSTSVYGKNLGLVDESTELSIDNTSSPLLLETEKYLRSRFSKITILRLGGLYGEKRHPVYFLAGAKKLKTGNEFLHLAHQSDCIKAIHLILEKEVWGETINIISDLRIKKIDYYTKMAKKLSLLLPEYEIGPESKQETNISNEKSKRILSLDYLDPNEFCESSS